MLEKDFLKCHINFALRWRFALIFRILQRNCGKYPSCGRRINFTYDYIALLFGVSVFPVLEREPCKAVMRKACRGSDAWREEMVSYTTETAMCISGIWLLVGLVRSL